MAISAKFLADFDAFIASTQGAERALKALESSGTKVGTEFEGLQKLARDLEKDFLAMFTARAAFNFVKDIVNDASALKDLSQQTHINIEELQQLAGAMSEFGVDADTLGKGLFRLSRNIAGGDESVAHGLHLMGMSLKDVEGLQGKELFLKIEEGLATLQGGLRDTAAADLFGGKLGAAMAGASEGIKGALATWEQFNHVMSPEAADALDKFGESITRANKNLTSITANMIGPVAEGFNVLFDAATQGASKWALAVSLLPKGLGIVGTGTEGLTKLIDELNQKTDDNKKKTVTGHQEIGKAIDTRTQAEKFMAKLEEDAAATLTASQIKSLEHLKELGALNAKNADGIGVNAAQFAKYAKDRAEAEKVIAEATKAALEAQKVLDDFEIKSHKIAMDAMKEERTERQKLLNERNTQVLEGLKAIQDAEKQTHDLQMQQVLSETDFQILKIWEVVEEQKKAFKGTEEQRAQFNDAVEALASEQETMLVAKAYETEAALQDHLKPAFMETAKAADQFFGTMVLGVQNLAELNKELTKFYDEWASNWLGTPGVGTPWSGVGTPVGVIGMPRMPNAGRASGGPVSAGSAYMVGERGPELFTPKSGGWISPNSSNQPIVVQLVVDGRVLAEVVNKNTTRSVLRNTKVGSV